MPNDDFTPDEQDIHRALLAMDRTSGPRSGFVAGLREDLLRNHQSVFHQDATVLDFPAPRTISASGRRVVRRRRWPQYLDAVAAATVLVLVAALAAAIGQSDETPRGAQVGTPNMGSGVGMLFGDAARTGVAPGPLPDGVPALMWEAATSEPSDGGVSAPVVVDRVVYAVRQTGIPTLENAGTAEAVFSGSGAAMALDLDTGGVLWETAIPDLSQTPAVAVADGMVFVATTDPGRALIALDAATGAERWAYDAYGGELRLPYAAVEPISPEMYAPVYADGVVYLGGAEGALHAVDAATGTRVWTEALSFAEEGGTPPVTSPAVAGGLVYIADNFGHIYAFDAATGALRWRSGTGGKLATTPVVVDGIVYIVATDVVPPIDGEFPSTLFAFDADDGIFRWVRQLEHPVVNAPTVVGHVVVLPGYGPDGSEVLGMTAATGDRLWAVDLLGPVTAAAVVGDTVVTGAPTAQSETAGGGLFGLDAITGRVRWQVVTSSAPTGPSTVANGLVVVPTLDGLIAFGAGAEQDGTTPASQVDAVLERCPVTPYSTAGPDPSFSYLWYGEGELVAGIYPDSWGVWYADPEGAKVHWFRPPGVSLSIEGHRLDGDAPPLVVRLPQGYETQAFQVSRLIFPAAGCWEVVGRTETAELRFVVDVRPGEQYRAATPVSEAAWDTLERRDTQERRDDATPLPATSGCPVSTVGVSDRVVGSVLGDGLVRVQGLGDGTLVARSDVPGELVRVPIYLVVEPRAAGPLAVRVGSSDGTGQVGLREGRMTPGGQEGGPHGLRLDGRGYAVPADGWVIQATLSVGGPGCYGIEIAGPSVTETVVFQVMDVRATPAPSR